MSFWLAIALAALAGVALLLLPALRARPAPDDSAERDQLRRFAEFEQDVERGDIDATTAPAARAELERAVLAAVPMAPSPATRAGTPRLLVLVCAGVPALALVLYLELGSPKIAEFLADHPGQVLSEPSTSLELLLDEVRRRVAAVPDDRAAWETLARAYLQLGRYAEAVAAAEKLSALAPRDSQAELVLIDALAMHANGDLRGRPLELIEQVLEREPDNVSALVLYGIAHDKAGRREAAVGAWQRALDAMPAEAPLRAELRAMIGSGEAKATAAPVAIEVKVSLAADLASRAAADDTVFIIARAVDGPQMPLAVARHTVAELPLTVTLDERMAMVPGSSLANFARVSVIARVSREGAPRAAAGDLEGRTAAFDPREQAVADVVIDTIVTAPANSAPR